MGAFRVGKYALVLPGSRLVPCAAHAHLLAVGGRVRRAVGLAALLVNLYIVGGICTLSARLGGVCPDTRLAARVLQVLGAFRVRGRLAAGLPAVLCQHGCTN